MALSALQGDASRATAKSRAYHEQRLAFTEPVYGLKKIRALVDALDKARDTDLDTSTNALPSKKYNSLTLQEKFTYCMIHGEVHSQNCDPMPAELFEERKIFGEPLGTSNNDESWSDRQLGFLLSHRRAVIGLLRDTIRSQHEVGLNLKQTIIELDAYEMIPDIVAVFQKSRVKDLDILSVACVLMRDGKFRPFLKSQTYRKMYGDKDANYQSGINDNPQNEELTISRAMAYYKSRMK
jgi:hypothetical protein